MVLIWYPGTEKADLKDVSWGYSESGIWGKVQFMSLPSTMDSQLHPQSLIYLCGSLPAWTDQLGLWIPETAKGQSLATE